MFNPTNAVLLPSFTGGSAPVTRYDEEFYGNAYPETEDLPEVCPSFYGSTPDTVWMRNSKHNSLFQRGDSIRFPLSRELPKDKDLVVDCLEFFLHKARDISGLIIELYLDNRKVVGIPYTFAGITRLDLKSLNISEKDRTLSYRKNLMIKFKKNGSSYGEMGIGYASPGHPAGHVKGRLQVRNRLLPQSTCQYLTDHNKNITGLADAQGKVVATWVYDAFGNIIQQTGTLAKRNPLRFSSEYHDEDLGLIYYNYRHYNPREGRWISRDIASDGGDNIYSFVKNSIQSIDVLGLFLMPHHESMSKACGVMETLRKGKCKQQRKEKIEIINNLLFSKDAKEPDCSDIPTCKKITLMIEASDPCQKALIQYGHAGIAIDDKFYDSGSNIVQQLGPYWSADNPTLTQAEKHANLVAKAPVLEVKFCASKKEYLAIQMKWHLMDITRTSGLAGPLGNTWGLGGTCSSSVARSLGKSGNPLISPDDLLTDIAPLLVNSCGSERGNAAYIKMLHNPWPKE